MLIISTGFGVTGNFTYVDEGHITCLWVETIPGEQENAMLMIATVFWPFYSWTLSIQWLGLSLLLPVWNRILSPDLSWSLTHSTGTFRVFIIFVFYVLFSLPLRLRIAWAGVCMLVCTCACLTFVHYNKREIFIIHLPCMKIPEYPSLPKIKPSHGS